MKQFGYETESSGNEITFVKRAGAALSAGVMAILAVSAVGVYAFVGGKNIPVDNGSDIYTEADTAVSQAENAVTAVDSTPDTYDAAAEVSPAAVTIKKAGIDEYDLLIDTVKAVDKEDKRSEKTAAAKTTKKKSAVKSAESSEKKNESKSSSENKKTTESEVVNTEPVTETAAETTTTTAAVSEAEEITSIVTTVEDSIELLTDTPEIEVLTDEEDDAEEIGRTLNIGAVAEDDVKNCAAMTLYTAEKVNLRTGASLDDDVMLVIPEGSEVIVTGYTDDWYRVKFDGNSGFCMKKYLTENAPEVSADTYSGAVVEYTEEEFDMLCYVLQGEVGNCSEQSKIAVANVILNRVKDARFPNSISGVLTQDNQFTAIYGYYSGSTVPSENTIECARRALMGEDNTNGAIYYYAPQYVGGETGSWFESLEFCMELDGQRYFK